MSCTTLKNPEKYAKESGRTTGGGDVWPERPTQYATHAGQTQNAQPQLTPEQQQQQQLANKERELSVESRLQPRQGGGAASEPSAEIASDDACLRCKPVCRRTSWRRRFELCPEPRGWGAPAPDTPKKGPEVNLNSAIGQHYVIFEDAVLDTVLMNRLHGDAVLAHHIWYHFQS